MGVWVEQRMLEGEKLLCGNSSKMSKDMKKEEIKKAEIAAEPYRAQWQKSNKNIFELLVW